MDVGPARAGICAVVSIGTGQRASRRGTVTPADDVTANSIGVAAMRRISQHHHALRYRAWRRSMVDARGGDVVFVSHCLLNQNTRYLGGAVCPGVVSAAIAPYVAGGTGIVQMPCPEQRVWGGVLKTRMLWLIAHPRVARAVPLLRPLLLRYVRLRYAHHARAIVRDVEDYLAGGFAVRGIVGVAGSPSCGVYTTLDLRRATAAIACRHRVPATAEWMNTSVVQPALRPGCGLFVDELARSRTRRNVDVPFLEEALPTP